MRLPPHRKSYCQGIHIYGIEEPCGEEVEPGSIFPMCKAHRVRLQQLPRQRSCAGALVYDEAMRMTHIACNEATGHPEVRLCASCRIKEKKSEERAHRELRTPCPTCGHLAPSRSAASTPQHGSRQAGGGQTSKYPPKSVRPRMTSPAPITDSLPTILSPAPAAETLPSSHSLWSVPAYRPASEPEEP